MIKSLRFRPGDDARALWTLAILVLALGSYLVESTYRGAIADAASQTESLNQRIAMDQRTLVQRAALLRVQSLAERDLERIARDLPLSMTTAQLLPSLERLGTHYGVTVEEIVPEQAAPFAVTSAPSLSVRSASDPWLLPTAVSLRVRGNFQPLLAFVENLSHDRTLLGVEDAQISSKGAEPQSGSHPALEATIHVTLYRLQLRTMEQRIAAAN